MNTKMHKSLYNITAARAVDRELLYIEWENFFPPTATTAATATATTTNNSNNKQEQQQMMIKQGTQGRGGGGGEGVTIQTQEPMDGEVKPTDGALMVEVRVTLQTQEPIEAVAEVRVAGMEKASILIKIL